MNFLFQAIIDGLLLTGIYVLISIGLSLSFGVTRIINFAHGEAIMLGAYAAYCLMTRLHIDPLLGLPAVFVAGFAGGYLLFRVAIEPLRNAAPVNQILLTFGIGLILQNGAVMLFTGDPRSLNPPYAFSSFEIGNATVSGGRLIAFGMAFALVGGLLLWLFRSELGRASRALAENVRAAALMGIRVSSLYAISFGISTGLGAAGGALLSFLLPVSPFMGFPLLVKAFAIIVLGGLGSIVGTVLGSAVLAFAETFVAYYVPDGNGWADGIAFLVLFCILVIRPHGLIGRHA